MISWSWLLPELDLDADMLNMGQAGKCKGFILQFHSAKVLENATVIAL